MRIGLIIADFDANFTTSFKHTARVKYNVDFDNSSIAGIQNNLQRLHVNMQTGNINNVHVGYDFTIQDVEHIQNLFETIVNKYKEYFPTLPPNKKIYAVINQLREADTPTPTDIAKDVVKEILTPQQPAKLTRQKQVKKDAESKSRERMLALLKKEQRRKS